MMPDSSLNDKTHYDFSAGPARFIPGDDPQAALRDEIGLCLSGGGYRAMLFHLGTLWRLHEVDLLRQISRVSSVSGGSITAGVLAFAWADLEGGGSFETLVAAPLYHLAKHTIDLPAIGIGLLPFVSAGEVLVSEYNRYLFKGASLQRLPDKPEFIFNSTNLQSLALWRFSKTGMRDWRVGIVANPTQDLAVAVAASSAFPPVLSPLVLHFENGQVQPMDGNDLHQPPYTTKVVLTDGGVYDNMGIETVWKSFKKILVSDAGGKMSPVPDPKTDWAHQGLQVLSMGDNQVRDLRKRQVVGSLVDKSREGAYWSVRSSPDDFPYKNCPIKPDASVIDSLANEPTRLASMDDTRIEQLVNWGYTMCEIAIQSWFAQPAKPFALPYPNSPI